MAETNKQRPQRLAIAAALATALALPAEGLRQVAYYDPPGILTVCRGHTGADVQKNVTYSLAQCDAWMTADMKRAIEQVDRCAPNLPPEVLAAFGDAAFNMGSRIACDTANSTAARYLHQYSMVAYKDAASGKPLLAAACNQLPRWDKANVAGVMVSLPGLTKRRAAERDLCLQGA
jgi:GH24 family phage-related lysozyme (muramidase)